MAKDKLLRVKGNTYFSDFEVLANDLLLFHRNHFRKSDSNEIDVFGHMWSLGIADLKPHQVSVKRNSEVISKTGLWAAFIPTFSIVDWSIQAGHLHWWAYLSSHKLPKDLPQRAIAFPVSELVNLHSCEEVFNLIRNRTETLYIEKEEFPNEVAKRTKLLIDETFEEDLSMADLAKQLKVSHSFMARAFKSAFGITPYSYRSKLRISESILLMLTQDIDVTTAGHEVGFNDSSRFSKQFHSFMNATPSQYCLQKKNRKLG